MKQLLALLTLATITSIAAPVRAQQPAAEETSAAPTLADYARRDAAVATALDLPRTTPAEQLRTIGLLLDLGQPDVAALIVPDLLKAKLADADRAALVRKFGSARFMELIRLDRPGAPAGFVGAREFAQKALDAAAAEAHDPARLTQLVKQLTTGSEDQRHEAQVDLAACGEPAVVACLSALAEAKDASARASLMQALLALRPESDAPILAALSEGSGQIRRDAAELAGHLKLAPAIPVLAALAAANPNKEVRSAASSALARQGFSQPSQAEALVLVRNRLAEIAKGAPVATGPAADGKGAWWSWDIAKQEPVRTEHGPLDLRTLAAARLARAMIEAGGDVDAADRRALLIYGYEEAALAGREPTSPFKERIAAATPAELSLALGAALRTERMKAGAAIARELGSRGDRAILITGDGLPSPLAAAAASPDRDVRFAALASVMKLAPPRGFAGASGVVNALWYFAGGSGAPTAIVASPVFQRASDWAAALRGKGFEATPTVSGREALIAALAQSTAPRLAIVLVDSEIGQPSLGEFIYQLRSDERTAHVPLVICSSVSGLAAAERLAEQAPRVVAIPRPHGQAAFQSVIDRGLALADPSAETIEVRQERAAQALKWIAELLTSRAGYDELIRDGAIANRALLEGKLTPAAIEVLASLGTAESQRMLVDYASSEALTKERREAAAAAFAKSVGRFGVQLTHSELLAQYDRYNASETGDADTQKILSGILDVIERKKK